MSVKKCWYYHENSEAFFQEEEGTDFGPESDFVWELGDVVTGTRDELEGLCRRHSSYVYDSLIANTCNYGWKEFFENQAKEKYFRDINKYLALEVERGRTVYPDKKNVFRAFKLTPFAKVKIVIVGQDPYVGENQADGLAFSVPRGRFPLPPSLVNVFEELCDDMGYGSHNVNQVHGNLDGWARQGVLLLNRVLTVRAGDPGSHSGIGWERLTDQAIKELSLFHKGLVFMLWGRDAQSVKRVIADDRNHLILEASHPSPKSVHQGFKGCRHFSKCNAYIKDRGRVEIFWDKKDM